MNKRFYPRLAAQSIEKNGKFYWPYILTVMGAAAALYMMLTTLDPRGIRSHTQFGALEAILGLGAVVVTLICAAFILYSNSFLIKQRGREFGLYSILGMSKKNIARMLLWETVFTAALGIGGGLVFGMVFSKLLLMVLSRLTGVEISGPLIYGACAWKTAAVFAILLAVTFLVNTGRVGLSQPIALLRGGSAGEREPKARWLLALLGAALLGAGYYIAIATRSPMQALLLFFVAVLLVIAGTFLLFLAGSVTVLKLLRRRKSYYYKTRHFIAVSGLMYRMKRNAAGLAIICILSTAVLVMLSSTVSLYAGMEDLLDASYPRQVMTSAGVSVNVDTSWRPDTEKALAHVGERGYHPENVRVFRSLAVSGLLTEDGYVADRSQQADGWATVANVSELYFIPLSDYEAVTGHRADLADGEVLADADTASGGTVSVFGKPMTVAGTLPDDEVFRAFRAQYSFAPVTAMVVTDRDFQTFYELQREGYGPVASPILQNLNFDLPAGDDARACALAVGEGYDAPDGLGLTGRLDDRETAAADLRGVFGGLLYLGIFLGVLFLCGTVLIIYYKQMSEGYEDQDRFSIMQKVGLSRPEIAGAIRSQVLLVFFLPLGTAVAHMAAACPLIVRLLRAFLFTDLPLFLGCVAVCVAVFAAMYTLVYTITARTYYGIVRGAQP